MEFRKHPIHGKYEASPEGDIYGPRGTNLKPVIHHTGYAVLTVGGKQYRWHRFVWECFNGLIEDYSLVINHKDGNKLNNKLENLELITQSENAFHAFQNKLRVAHKGSEIKNSKLSEETCKQLILELNSLTNNELGIKYNLHPRYVSLIRHRRRWVHVWQEIDNEIIVENFNDYRKHT